MKRTSVLLLSLISIASLTLAACCAPPEATPQTVELEVTRVVKGEAITEIVTVTPMPKGGGTMGFRLAEDPETLDGVLTISITAHGAMDPLYDRLFYFDSEGQVQGWLAKSWTVNEDQTVITVELHEGVQFHDGTDLDAAAVKAHFDRILDPAIASPNLASVGSLQEVNVVDTYTVEFVFEEPYAAFFINLTQAYFGIPSPTAVEELGDDFGRNPVGSGPFMFKEWIPGSQITLVKNPNYKQLRGDAVNQGPPLMDELVFHVIVEDSVAEAALATGEIIAASLSSDAIPTFLSDPNYQVVVDDLATNLTFLEFNYQKAPFDDPQFRRALGFAIDNEAISLAARGGYANPAYSPLAVGIPGFDQAVADEYGMHYDPDTAIQMLADLGWEDTDGDGLLDKDGQPARFRVLSYAGYNHITRSLEVIQDNFKDIGIEIEIELSDWGAFYPALLEEDWDMDLMRWTWDDASVMYDLLRSPGHRSKLPEDPELDEVLDLVATTMDPELRAVYISQAQQMILERGLIVPNITNWTMFAIRSNVNDYTLDFLGYLIWGDVWVTPEE